MCGMFLSYHIWLIKGEVVFQRYESLWLDAAIPYQVADSYVILTVLQICITHQFHDACACVLYNLLLSFEEMDCNKRYV